LWGRLSSLPRHYGRLESLPHKLSGAVFYRRILGILVGGVLIGSFSSVQFGPLGWLYGVSGNRWNIIPREDFYEEEHRI
jgi:hypothetical protein